MALSRRSYGELRSNRGTYPPKACLDLISRRLETIRQNGASSDYAHAETKEEL
jgi:hypothetical protein